MNLQGLKYTLPHLVNLSKQITSPFTFQMQIQNTKSVKSLLIHTTTSTTRHQPPRRPETQEWRGRDCKSLS